MSAVEINNEMPADHPGRQDIEDTLRQLLARRVGHWRVQIRRSRFDAASWFLTLDRTSQLLGPYHHSVLLDPEHQTPEQVESKVSEALRAAEKPEGP